MATWLTSERVPGTAPVQMSNGLTSGLFDVLCLAACSLATSDWEQALNALSIPALPLLSRVIPPRGAE